MKQILFIFIGVIFLSCKTSKEYTEEELNIIGLELYSGLKYYYYNYEEYPLSIEEMIEYFDDSLLDKTTKKEQAKTPNIKDFLIANQKIIKIENTKEHFILKYKKKLIEIER